MAIFWTSNPMRAADKMSALRLSSGMCMFVELVRKFPSLSYINVRHLSYSYRNIMANGGDPHMNQNKIILTALFALSCCQADVTLPALIGDHMLVQRDMPVRIFGKAAPGEAVT